MSIYEYAPLRYEQKKCKNVIKSNTLKRKKKKKYECVLE